MTDDQYKILNGLFSAGISANANDRGVVVMLVELEKEVFSSLKEIEEIKSTELKVEKKT